MANTSIPNLPPVIALSGAEQLEVVQAGTSSRATVSQIAAASQGSVYTIATLPAASSNSGIRAFVSNGAAIPVFGGLVSATGTVFAPVYSDGTAWRYG